MQINEFPEIKENVLLSGYTTLKIGGPAKYFYTAKKIIDLAKILQLAGKNRLPIKVIGQGSKILFSDNGFPGLIIKNASNDVEFLGNGILKVASGYPLPLLISQLIERNLDASCLVGIPGTIGGAICNNAGAWGGTISDSFLSAQLLNMNSGEISKIGKHWFQFEYRNSRLKHDTEQIVIEVNLKFTQQNAAELAKKASEYLKLRQEKQPAGNTCGSVFKNPEGKIAGKLIEDCGLKGHQIGGIKISEKHANFFENTGKATACDFLKMAEFVINKVLEKFKVKLEPEFQPLGFDAKEVRFLYA
ncbi:MAG: UDP-N-acetylmuramate dehydrogenase [Patescibacteria group bacterium]|nr:UDP-N-acetylmuramate dehydrogenase [Patescibacteria group bacterium]